MARDDIAEIKSRLVERIEDVARELAPGGRRNGRYWMARSPIRADQHAGSFWVNLSGPMAGTYHDAATGETGDMLTLAAKVYGLDFKGAADWARGLLGLAAMPQTERRQWQAEADERRARQEEEARAELEKGRKWAFGTFVAAKRHSWAGSPADLYLQSRGIDLRQLGRMPGCLGWLPEQWHVESERAWPVMIACFTGPDERIVAVHQTFVAPDGSGKAPVSPARKIRPGFAGAAIRVWRGESKMSPKEAAAHGLRETLVLTEGVEDALSVALARPDLRVWAVGSLGNFGAVVLPECADAVIVCADNDWGKPQAEALLKRGLEALIRQGVAVSVARATIGKDVNDQLRGGDVGAMLEKREG